MPLRLTSSEIDARCRELLAPITMRITRKLGPEAADLTGSCLLEALHKYDSSKGVQLEPWVRYKTLQLVKDTLRQQNGRKGGARYAALASQSEVQDFDALEAVPDDRGPLEAKETVALALKKLSKIGKWRRLLFLGHMQSFTLREIQGVLGVSKPHIYREASELRQLLSVN